MPVIASTYELDSHVQRDGRRYVMETHTLNEGTPVVIHYLAEAGADYAAIMNSRVPIINESLASAEFEEAISGV